MPTRPALLTINDPAPIRIDRRLAAEIGFEQSIVFLQIEFLIRQVNNVREGRYWTYQTLKDLRARNFPWWSTSTISRILDDLERKNLLIVSNFNQKKTDRTSWFALNEEGITLLNSVKLSQINILQNENSISQNEECILQDGKCIMSNCNIHYVKLQNVACASDSEDLRLRETKKEDQEPQFANNANAGAPVSPPQPEKPAKRKTPFPEDFKLNQHMCDWLEENATHLEMEDVLTEMENMRDWALSKGEKRLDWIRFFYGWIRRANQKAKTQSRGYQRSNEYEEYKPNAKVKSLFGKGKDQYLG